MKLGHVIVGAAVLMLSGCSIGERETAPGPIIAAPVVDTAEHWTATFPRLSAHGEGDRVRLGPIIEKLNADVAADTEEFRRAADAMFDCLANPPEGGCDAFAFPGAKITQYLEADSVERAGLVVVRFRGYADFLGNHPANISHGRAFDASTGDEVKLGDVLDAADLEAIRPTAMKAIVDEIGMDYTDSDWLAEGLANPESYATWWPTDEGLHVIFADYAVAAHAAGTPEIVIPWDEFSGADVARLGGG